ncbi:unnamed protein product [Paramecium octaurelia]|uniref:Uncharacterized protein n=1 Tax=Paramecium octaurelia TaxID=43137 RepID=A0A8S1XFP4_PAROT|nr:unnamed protein product [Paramecium octaurelia]
MFIDKIYTVTLLHDFDYPLNENKQECAINQTPYLTQLFFKNTIDCLKQFLRFGNSICPGMKMKYKPLAFFVNIACPKSGNVEMLQFKWFAIDDQRIQVINCYNMTEIKRKTFQTTTLIHYQDMSLQQVLVLKEKWIFISKFYNQIQPL